MNIIYIIISVVIILIAAAFTLYFLLKCSKCGDQCFDKSEFRCVDGSLCPVSQYANPSLCCGMDSVVHNGQCSKLTSDNYGNICPEYLYNSDADICCKNGTSPCGNFCSETCDETKHCPSQFQAGNNCCRGACNGNCCVPGFPHCVGGTCYDMCPYKDGTSAAQFDCVPQGVVSDANNQQCISEQMSTSKCCKPGSYFNWSLRSCVECTNNMAPCGDSCCAAGSVCGKNNVCCNPNNIDSKGNCCLLPMPNGDCCESGTMCNGLCCPIDYQCINNKCVRQLDNNSATFCGEYQTRKYVNGEILCSDPPCPGPQFNGKTCCSNGQFYDGECKSCTSNMAPCGTSCCPVGKQCIAGIACV